MLIQLNKGRGDIMNPINCNIIVENQQEFSSAFSVAFGIISLFSILALLGIAQRILSACAAYYDARSKCNKDAVMWALLIGFLGLIPEIIYLCVRNSGRNFVICTNCGLNHSAYDTNCRRCGAPNQNSSQFMNPLAANQAHRAKVLLITALVLIGVGFITAIVGFFLIGSNMADFAGGYVYY